jgi:predicted protein tyrosine phosphatase
MHVTYHLLQITSLPTLKNLQAWEQKGISYLLNVSGVDISDIYSAQLLMPFEIKQISLHDVFTKNPPVQTLPVLISPQAYLQVSDAEQQQALFNAVQLVIAQLQNQTPTCVFCHRGVGRSTLVVACAFQQFYNESIAQAIERTRAIRPAAQFSDISLAAMQWCYEQFKD